eukprot:SAG11_NODE_1348_length_5137_cov_3.785232_1_plen_116_part_00
MANDSYSTKSPSTSAGIFPFGLTDAGGADSTCSNSVPSSRSSHVALPARDRSAPYSVSGILRAVSPKACGSAAHSCSSTNSCCGGLDRVGAAQPGAIQPTRLSDRSTMPMACDYR